MAEVITDRTRWGHEPHHHRTSHCRLGARRKGRCGIGRGHGNRAVRLHAHPADDDGARRPLRGSGCHFGHRQLRRLPRRRGRRHDVTAHGAVAARAPGGAHRGGCHTVVDAAAGQHDSLGHRTTSRRVRQRIGIRHRRQPDDGRVAPPFAAPRRVGDSAASAPASPHRDSWCCSCLPTPAGALPGGQWPRWPPYWSSVRGPHTAAPPLRPPTRTCGHRRRDPGPRGGSSRSSSATRWKVSDTSLPGRSSSPRSNRTRPAGSAGAPGWWSAFRPHRRRPCGRGWVADSHTRPARRGAADAGRGNSASRHGDRPRRGTCRGNPVRCHVHRGQHDCARRRGPPAGAARRCAADRGLLGGTDCRSASRRTAVAARLPCRSASWARPWSYAPPWWRPCCESTIRVPEPTEPHVDRTWAATTTRSPSSGERPLARPTRRSPPAPSGRSRRGAKPATTSSTARDGRWDAPPIPAVAPHPVPWANSAPVGAAVVRVRRMRVR